MSAAKPNRTAMTPAATDTHQNWGSWFAVRITSPLRYASGPGTGRIILGTDRASFVNRRATQVEPGGRVPARMDRVAFNLSQYGRSGSPTPYPSTSPDGHRTEAR